MRPDAIGLRTWWLATFAGWALLMCVLGALGLGGRVQRLGDDGSTRPLPALPAAGSNRLGAFDQYDVIATRPVFAEDRRPHPFLLGGTEGAGSSGLRLTGVLITPDFQMATFTTDQGKSLRLRLQGDGVDGWQLLSLAPRSATVAGPNGTQTLELQVFNGQGGTPPTVLAGPAGAGSRASSSGAAAHVAPSAGAAPTVPAAAATTPNAPPPLPSPTADNADGEASDEPTGPSAEQLNQIRERIEARRRALQQQNRSQGNATPPPGQNR
ncbi:MAG TPA: hypothetical protein VGC74_05315 [Stenotrophomonas sp.]|jgi:general secretion pathway protein N